MSGFDWVTVASGVVIGFSLGLTGGGGSIFALPLLIYLLGAGVREAVGISLVAVGATSLFGALLRLRAGELEWKTGLIFALAGMGAAPLGTALGARLPTALTLTAFSLLMVGVGVKMWRGNSDGLPGGGTRHCARTEKEVLSLTPRCFLVLGTAGLLTGALSGLFGVGGGFIVVPALVLVSGMPTHRAVTTSLLVIAMICASGVAAYYLSGEGLPGRLTLWFLGGGFLGMFLGIALRSRLSGTGLNRVFAAAMWAVALFMIAKNWVVPLQG
jgi:uncharacterized membrane protein YfcA